MLVDLPNLTFANLPAYRELKLKPSLVNTFHTTYFLYCPNKKLATILLSLAAIGLSIPSDTVADADTKHTVGTACPVSSRKSCSLDRRFVVCMPVDKAPHIDLNPCRSLVDALPDRMFAKRRNRTAFDLAND